MRVFAAIALAFACLAGQPAATRSASACAYWTQGLESKNALDAAGIKRICVPAVQADAWRSSGLEVVAVTDADLAARETLQAPGIVARPGVASPTRAPWIAITIDRKRLPGWARMRCGCRGPKPRCAYLSCRATARWGTR